MENKSNEATALRPEGDRVLNAPLVEMDLNKFMQQIKADPSRFLNLKNYGLY